MNGICQATLEKTKTGAHYPTLLHYASTHVLTCVDPILHVLQEKSSAYVLCRYVSTTDDVIGIVTIVSCRTTRRV